MDAFQYYGDIYYRLYKDVNPGVEFLVWYGQEYAKDLGIDVVDNEMDERHFMFMDAMYLILDLLNLKICYITKSFVKIRGTLDSCKLMAVNRF